MSLDKAAASELVLYIENDGDLYRQRTVPILRNLANKAAQGKYDHSKSIKLWMYLMDDGAKKYAKEFASSAEWNRIFSTATRKQAAAAFADDFEANWKAGEYRYYLTKVSAKKLGATPSPRTMGHANRSGGTSQAFNVYLNGKLIDTVFYSGDMDADDVYRSLVRHDGYDNSIVVTKRRSPKRSAKRSNRSGSGTKTKPRPLGTDRDKYHGNPNARRNMAGSKQKYSGWFLSDGQLTLAIRGHEQLVRQPKKGIPSGAFSFGSKEEAESELAFIRRQGRYPLWSDKAYAVKLEWS